MTLSDFEQFRINARRNFDHTKSKRPTRLHEGVDLSSPHLLGREDLITRIKSMVRSEKFVFLRAAPMSEKSSITQLLALHYF